MTRRLTESIGAALMGILLVFGLVALTGCDDDLVRENKRINQKAESESPAVAVQKIQQKYGFEAQVVGVTTQSDNMTSGNKVLPFAYVVMRHGDHFFVTLLNVDDPDVFFDNYQAEEIVTVIDEYFAQVQDLPLPYASDTSFICTDYPEGASKENVVYLNEDEISSEGKGVSETPTQRREPFDVRNMTSFSYTGQPAQELLQRMGTLDIANSYVGTDVNIEGLGFDPNSGAWPNASEFTASMTLSTYSNESDYRSIAEISFYNYDWWRRNASLHVATSPAEHSENAADADVHYAYVKKSTTDIGGYTVIGRNCADTAEAVKVSDAIPSWEVDEIEGTQKSETLSKTFSQVTPLFSVSAEAQEAAFAAAKEQDPERYFSGCFFLEVPQSLRAQDGSFFLGKYYPDSDEVEVSYYDARMNPEDKPQAIMLLAKDASRDERVCYAILQPSRNEQS